MAESSTAVHTDDGNDDLELMSAYCLRNIVIKLRAENEMHKRTVMSTRADAREITQLKKDRLRKDSALKGINANLINDVKVLEYKLQVSTDANAHLKAGLKQIYQARRQLNEHLDRYSTTVDKNTKLINRIKRDGQGGCKGHQLSDEMLALLNERLQEPRQIEPNMHDGLQGFITEAVRALTVFWATAPDFFLESPNNSS